MTFDDNIRARDCKLIKQAIVTKLLIIIFCKLETYEIQTVLSMRTTDRRYSNLKGKHFVGDDKDDD